MIYFKKTQPGPTQALLAQKATASTNYDIDGVRDQLASDFFEKCYLCGFRSTSMRIEHFRPHLGDRDRMFDWHNLFYACEHCNSLKSDGYRGLLDCTQITNIDQLIAFCYDPAGAIKEKVTFIDHQSNSSDTVELLQMIFSAKNTPTKRLGAMQLEKKLGEALRDFEYIVQQYVNDPTPTNTALLKFEVNNQSEFTAFKRWKVRCALQDYPPELPSWFLNG